MLPVQNSLPKPGCGVGDSLPQGAVLSATMWKEEEEALPGKEGLSRESLTIHIIPPPSHGALSSDAHIAGGEPPLPWLISTNYTDSTACVPAPSACMGLLPFKPQASLKRGILVSSPRESGAWCHLSCCCSPLVPLRGWGRVL